MVKQVDPVTGQVTNVSQRKAEKLKNDAKNLAQSFDESTVSDAATKAGTDLGNSVQTAAGSVAGQVEGGIKSLTSKVDGLKDVTVEGLVDDGVESLQNMATDQVEGLVNGLISKAGLGATVEIAFSEPDSNGMVYPISSSLDAEGGVSGTVAAVLQTITGLGVGPGSLQQAVIDAAPKGLVDAGKNLLEGKIGAFTAGVINTATETVIKSVTDELQSVVGVAQDINRVVQGVITAVDSDGFGEAVLTTTNVTANMPVADSEFSNAITKVKDNVFSDLQNQYTDAKGIIQSAEGIIDDMQNLSGGKNGKDVFNSIKNERNSRDRYQRITEEKSTLIKSRTGNRDIGIIQSLSSETLQDLVADVKNFVAPGKISTADAKRVIDLSQGSAADIDTATRLLEQASNKTYKQIRNFLLTLDTTITEATREAVPFTIFEEPYVIGTYEKEWNKGQGDPIFPYVSSVEELQAELRNIKRDITEFVVHWTETPTNKNIGSEEINGWHLEENLEGIGYHYVIRRDGTLQKGRPVNLVGQHAEVNNHNENSIGIVFVGGINVPSGVENIQDFVSVQSLTRSQFNTFDHFCRAFFTVFPGGQALGHNDIEESEEDPGFDVREYALANFGKQSKFKTPNTQGPFTPSEIIEDDE